MIRFPRGRAARCVRKASYCCESYQTGLKIPLRDCNRIVKQKGTSLIKLFIPIPHFNVMGEAGFDKMGSV